MQSLLICLVLLLWAPLEANAQEAGSVVLPDTAPGDRLTVTTRSGLRFQGRLVTNRNGALVLLSNRREETIAHVEIERVTRRHNRFLFGPLIGLGAGLLTGLPAKRRFDNEGRDGAVVLAWTAGIGVGLGSLIDLMNGSDRTIFTNKPQAVVGLEVRP